jgi:hypothetical protein
MTFRVASMRLSPLARLAPLLLLALAGCRGSPELLPTSGIPCEKDSDCSPPACGPCTPGAELTQSAVSCAVNPCPGVVVGCSARRVCAVR